MEAFTATCVKKVDSAYEKKVGSKLIEFSMRTRSLRSEQNEKFYGTVNFNECFLSYKIYVKAKHEKFLFRANTIKNFSLNNQLPASILTSSYLRW